jgi:hypothetical protein
MQVLGLGHVRAICDLEFPGDPFFVPFPLPGPILLAVSLFGVLS